MADIKPSNTGLTDKLAAVTGTLNSTTGFVNGVAGLATSVGEMSRAFSSGSEMVYAATMRANHEASQRSFSLLQGVIQASRKDDAAMYAANPVMTTLGELARRERPDNGADEALDARIESLAVGRKSLA